MKISGFCNDKPAIEFDNKFIHIQLYMLTADDLLNIK